MKKRVILIVSVAVLLVAAAILGLAQGHMRGKFRGPHGDMVEHIARELNLSEEQKSQAKSIFDAARATSEERHNKLEAIHKQLDELTASGQFDEAKVRPLANEQAQLMADEMVDHMRTHSQLFALLNAEQKAKAQEMMKAHGGRGRGHHGFGRGHGGPPPPPPGVQQ